MQTKSTNKFYKYLVLLIVLALIGLFVLLLVNNPINKLDDLAERLVQDEELIKEENGKPQIMIGPTNIADMVDEVSSAVVNIETSIVQEQYDDWYFFDPFFRDFIGEAPRQRQNIQRGIGTGFIISEDGYVITNQHVIDNASDILVNINNEDKKYPAIVVGQDYELDLAVLKIQSNEKFVKIKMGDSDKIRIGEWAIAIGNPYGLDHTVTAGVISATGRPIKIADRIYKNLIQTDAAINPGNSGGPLLNTNGEVIGINTAVSAQAQGIGFAISINTAKEVLDELIEKGKVIRPYMGVWLQAVDENIATHFNIPQNGVMIAEIEANGSADRAGLLKYDIIIAIDGNTINDAETLQDILKERKVGDRINIIIIRDGQEKTISLLLAEKP